LGVYPCSPDIYNVVYYLTITPSLLSPNPSPFLALQFFGGISTSGADRYAFGGLRSGPKGLEVGGPASGLEATQMQRAKRLFSPEGFLSVL
jgi:hypothetical protein